jgi:NDP-sugar pyrophosphorylase family protein
LNAESHLRGSENFIVINVDVDTDFDLNCIIKFHKENNPLATMAVQKRNAARNLEFDKDMHLIGKEAEGSDKNGLYAFNGIHVISDRIFEKGYEVKFNGILEMYFDLIKNGEYILGCDTGKCWFQDLGKAHIILNS